MEPRTSTLLGYTEDELDQYFNDFIKSAAEELNYSVPDIRKSMKNWYNGYRFSRDNKKVYNPFSLHRFLDGKFFENHWFSSGNPAFLFKLMEKHNYPIEKIENISLDKESILAFDLDKIALNVLLYQTGYLTITDFDAESGLYTLNYPNREVRESFLKNFLHYSSQKQSHAILNRT